jgi:hypothetical protein
VPRTGLIGGLALAIAGGLIGRAWVGLAFGLTTGIGTGIAFTFAVSQAWLGKLGFLLLSHDDLFPRDGIRFLRVAHERGILRAVGTAVGKTTFRPSPPPPAPNVASQPTVQELRVMVYPPGYDPSVSDPQPGDLNEDSTRKYA